MSYLFTSESVSAAHPDKLCDQISDALLDAHLKEDKESRVALETFAKGNMVVVGGEVTTNGRVIIEDVVKKVIRDVGYTKEEYGFNADSCVIISQISRQSPDIAQGVNSNNQKEQGAGDQGLMFGFATDETEEYMPLPISLAHKVLEKLSKIRVEKGISYLRPDAKSQVTIEYEGNSARAHTIVVSTQHDPGVNQENIKKDIIEKVIIPVCGNWIDERTIFHINPTGSFVLGGPVADAGLTGRKIIVDTYGGAARHGGGAFSGKDQSKVDRSAAYAARYIAKNIVASGIAKKCEVQIAYAIGLADPVSLYVDCFGTNKIPEVRILELIKQNFPLKPADIIKQLDLKQPIYQKTAAYGHFGRAEPGFSWEKTDKAEILKTAIIGL